MIDDDTKGPSKDFIISVQGRLLQKCRDTLFELQWSAEDSILGRCCPQCGEMPPTHDPVCELGNLLAKLDAK